MSDSTIQDNDIAPRTLREADIVTLRRRAEPSRGQLALERVHRRERVRRVVVLDLPRAETLETLPCAAE
ncbi:MAG: hypothetical protein RLO52_38915 [Sandaracinaceae bacterium]